MPEIGEIRINSRGRNGRGSWTHHRRRILPEWLFSPEPEFNEQLPNADTMPYFIYKITPPLQLTHIDTKQAYKDARTLVRELRNGQSKDADIQFRMVFAKDRSEAERLLSTPRDERVIGED